MKKTIELDASEAEFIRACIQAAIQQQIDKGEGVAAKVVAPFQPKPKKAKA